MYFHQIQRLSPARLTYQISLYIIKGGSYAALNFYVTIIPINILNEMLIIRRAYAVNVVMH